MQAGVSQKIKNIPKKKHFKQLTDYCDPEKQAFIHPG